MSARSTPCCARTTTAPETAWDGYQQVEAMRAVLTARMPADSTSEAAKAIAAFRAKVDTVGGNAGGGGGGGPRRPPPNFYGMNGALALELTAQDNADQAPTAAMLAGYAARCRDLRTAVDTLDGDQREGSRGPECRAQQERNPGGAARRRASRHRCAWSKPLRHTGDGPRRKLTFSLRRFLRPLVGGWISFVRNKLPAT